MKILPGRRAAAYARYSTANQTKLSIERQLYGIEQYCENAGLNIVGYYADEATTGTNMDRADFMRLIADAEQGLIDCVVIYDMTRGSRDIADWFTFRKEMKRLGIRVISVTSKLGDIDNPDDFLTEGVTAILGQHQVAFAVVFDHP
jgi:site-specific DNA recombinase